MSVTDTLHVTEEWLTSAETLMHVTARPANSGVATFRMQPVSRQAFHSVAPQQPCGRAFVRSVARERGEQI